MSDALISADNLVVLQSGFSFVMCLWFMHRNEKVITANTESNKNVAGALMRSADMMDKCKLKQGG